MISIVLYGRNDSYGYNLHKRAALGINTMAELLSDPADEILFVDYNSPDDHPTFPEAIADTLTDRAVARMRVLRVRPAVHDRFKGRTHLLALEPIARNVGIRRSNPENRWVLSTNTDMIFVPRVPGTSLSSLAADLTPGFYHIPRFELPESLWEGFDRRDPACVIEQVRACGRSLFLNEIVYGIDFIKYDGPGDFQLMLRDDLFQFQGFNEDMLIGWHVDSNIAKRLHLHYGAVGDLVERLFGYHCDHTRQVTPAHHHASVGNDVGVFIDQVTEPGLPCQATSWGCADDEIEEIRLARSAHHVYLESVRAATKGEWSEPATARYTSDSYDRTGYDARHVLPFLTDLFASAPRDWTVRWLGGRRDTFRMFCDVWERMGFRGRVLIDDWSVPLLSMERRQCVEEPDPAGIEAQADVLVFDFGAPSESPDSMEALGLESAWVDAAVDRLMCRSLVDIAADERKRMAGGVAPRRFICINAIHNRYEGLVRGEIGAAATPFATRLRHGFVIPRDLPPPEADSAPPKAQVQTRDTADVLDVPPGILRPEADPAPPKAQAQAHDTADVLARMHADDGGRHIDGGILAPFGRRGYVLRGMPYERLLPGEYHLEFSIRRHSVFTLAARIRSIIVEVVAGETCLARTRVKFLLHGQPHIRFFIPFEFPEGRSGVEIRLFRGRYVDFVVTGVRLWSLPSLGVPPQKPARVVQYEPGV